MAVKRNPFQSFNQGGTDSFVSRLSLIPQGTSRIGSPSSTGASHPTIHVLSDPTPNNAQFGFACSQGPANTVGILAFSLGLFPTGVPVGFKLYLDPGQPTVILPAITDAAGESVFKIAYPGTQIPVPVYAQYIWSSTSASDAVKF